MDNKELQAIPTDGVVIKENVPLIADDSIMALAEQADKRLSAIKKVMEISLKITSEHDWVNIGGVPYLQATGADKVARLFGVTSQILNTEKTLSPDGHYTYSYRMSFAVGGSSMEADGMRSSSDEFFTGKDVVDKETGKVIKKKKTADEIDERDVKLAAYTNCMNNGIKRLLGLRGVTIETLSQLGIDTSRFKGYGFNSAAPKEETAESADLRAEMKRMLSEICGGEATRIKNAVKHYTSFQKDDGSIYQGKDCITKLTEKQLKPTYGKIKKDYEEWVKKNAKGTTEPAPQNNDEEDDGLPFD